MTMISMMTRMAMMMMGGANSEARARKAIYVGSQGAQRLRCQGSHSCSRSTPGASACHPPTRTSARLSQKIFEPRSTSMALSSAIAFDKRAENWTVL